MHKNGRLSRLSIPSALRRLQEPSAFVPRRSRLDLIQTMRRLKFQFLKALLVIKFTA